MQIILYTILGLYAIGICLRILFRGNKIINLNLNEPWIGEALRKYLDNKKKKNI